MIKKILILIFIISRVSFAETVLNSVAASVNGEPILLSDIDEFIQNGKKVKLQDLSDDIQAKQAVEALILQKLILNESEKRRVGTSPDEIQLYLKEIASNNNLTIEEFKLALKNENKDIESLKNQIKVEILRRKLANQIFKEGISISEKEINDFLNEDSIDDDSEKKLKLRQIFLSNKSKTKEELVKKLEEIKKEFKNGSSFADLAKKYSESPDATDGGNLGILTENDLHPKISNAVSSLKNNEISEVTFTDNGAHLFLLVDRIENNLEANKEATETAKKALKEQKIERKMKDFFAKEIYQNYSIDRKY